MNTRRATLGFAAVLCLAAVSSGPTDGSDGSGRAERAEAVRQAELAFAATVVANDPEAFASFIDEDAVFVGSSGATVGRDAIVKAWAGFFGPGRPDFSWRPEIVELSGDGTLALSRGPWNYRGKSPEGEVVEQSGVFNSIWRRQEDGSWKVVFDAGCSPCPE